MCGITGAFRYVDEGPTPDEATGLRMVETLNHRGPDDGGLLVGPGVLLGHRRLAILDPSPLGHQPMSDARGEAWIVYNGEVYNFRSLRGELEQRGHRFRSQTDTEVVLASYLEWGQEAFARLNGMFALAIWDSRCDRLLLARDPVGIKPLFFHDDGRVLRFGSEIKAILADPAVARRADLVALDAFLTFGYTPAPRTGFEGIRQLLPGECLVSERGNWRTEEFCRLALPERPQAIAESDAVERLGQEIDAAVRRQMISDVPLGGLLSGGLDSSAVVRSMRRSSEAVETFTIGFGEPSFDESPVAERIAELLGTRHHTRHVTADAAMLLPRLVSHAEEPFADNSMIPFFLLSEFVRKHVSVALSGDGADELLAGYSTYAASRFAPWYRRIPRPLRNGMIGPAVRRLPPSTRKYGLPMLLRRFVEGAEQPFPRDHCSWRQIVSPQLKPRLYTDEFRQATAGADAIGLYAAAIGEAPASASRLDQQLYGDFRFHLPNDMLVKADRMSMAHSLEVRVPLLDLEVVRYCFSLPPDLKRRGRRGKYVLRLSVAETLPEEIVNRRKAGFVVPIEAWMRGPLRAMLDEFLDEPFLRRSGLFDPQAVRTLIESHASGRRDHAYELFALLVWSIWWRIWIERSMPASCVRPRAAAPVVVQRLARLGAVE
jgi:asparagine synthase (glutamine-hydrolysing)